MFGSVRERRLWTWTVVVVATTYATLALARTLSDDFVVRRVFDNMFVFSLAVVGVSIVVLAFGTYEDARERPDVGLALGVGLSVVSACIMVIARMGIPEQRTHLFEYGIVALLIQEALRERKASGRFDASPALWAAILGSLVGVVDECIQAFVPGRVFDPVDMGFNTLAAFGATGVRAGLGQIRSADRTH